MLFLEFMFPTDCVIANNLSGVAVEFCGFQLIELLEDVTGVPRLSLYALSGL